MVYTISIKLNEKIQFFRFEISKNSIIQSSSNHDKSLKKIIIIDSIIQYLKFE